MARSKYRKTRRNTKYKRKTTKNNKRNKKYTKKRNKYKKNIKKQFGGDFNKSEKQRLRQLLQQHNFTEEQITEIIGILSPVSQQFTKPNEFQELLNQLGEVEEFEEIKDWVTQISEMFVNNVGTDTESLSSDIDDDN
jgi:truncated hemoglobin YjbI